MVSPRRSGTERTSVAIGWVLAISLAGAGVRFQGQVLFSRYQTSDRSTTTTGLKYLPQLQLGYPLPWGFVNADLTGQLDWPVTGDGSQPTAGWYRALLRTGGDTWDLQGGLQQINFGPGRYLRSLRWFDAIDPTDPLQLTNGVKGLRLDAYGMRSVTRIWLLENSRDLRGLESIPGRGKTPEYGGRWLISSGGDWGITFHHRQIGAAPGAIDSAAQEWRLAFDGAVDVGPGLWFEWVENRRDYSGNFPGNQEYFLTVGGDYTLPLWSGVTVAVESFQERLGSWTDPRSRLRVMAVDVRLPVNFTDTLSWLTYRNSAAGWTVSTWSWQRVLDAWIVYLGWIHHTGSLDRLPSGAPFSDGLYLALIFNHG
ncbi:MAG: hypothetical protein D6762_01650 [Candidatus Neomarinimicrobiota bacterium]|nr:MAG: hypothetical protein D6762_01650 [Candidatus Neomarinimicrobiota bacterium]